MSTVPMPLYRIVHDSFQKSLDRLADQKLPIKAMYKLKGIINLLREEYKKFDDLRTDIAKKYADKDEAGNPIYDHIADPASGRQTTNYKLSKENLLLLAVEVKQLSVIEVDVPTIKVSDLGPDVMLTTTDLINLDFIVQDEEDA